jgi:hypothetical protein
MWRKLARKGTSRTSVCWTMPVTAGLTAIVALALCSTALAAGKPVNIATPFDIIPPGPSVAVDNAGNAVIAWANDKDLAGAPDLAQYCVMPPQATSCLHSGSLTAADSANHIDGVKVLSVGNTLVILADVFGAAGNNAGDYTPEQEWQSTDDGASWTLLNSGLSVTSGILNADTGPLSAVILPGTGVLGYGWDTAAGPPTFNAFPLTAPPECSVTTCPAGFATLEPATNPDTLGNEPGQFASTQTGPNAGVMGVFDTLNTNGPLGCAQSFGTGYVYGSGAQSATNNYNISPGQANSAWKVALAQVDCNAEYSAVGGGPSGFGILEDNLGTRTVAYHRFDASTMKFDTPLATVNGTAGELDPAVNQDGQGDVFATYLLGGDGGPIELSYSADGGKTWTGGSLDADKDGQIGSVNSSVNAKGQGWVSWFDNGSVFAQSFQASDAITPASVSGGATTNGSTVTVDVSCAAYPCTITITLTAPETVVVNAHTASLAAKKGKKKTKIITLGKGTFTLKSKGAKKQLSVKLSAAGKRFLTSKKGHVRISAALIEKVQGKKVLSSKSLSLAIKPSKKNKK